MEAGVIGGAIGAFIGLLGGVIGTWCSINNTRGPRERRFMIKASIVAWVAIGLFLLLMVLLPTPYRWWLWLPYGIFLPLGIHRINRSVSAIRAEEEATQANG